MAEAVEHDRQVEPALQIGTGVPAAGEAVFGPDVAGRMLRQFGADAPALPDPLHRSERPRARGARAVRRRARKKIARRLFLSPKTVRTTSPTSSPSCGSPTAPTPSPTPASSDSPHPPPEAARHEHGPLWAPAHGQRDAPPPILAPTTPTHQTRDDLTRGKEVMFMYIPAHLLLHAVYHLIRELSKHK
jgi:hypothetical protein